MEITGPVVVCDAVGFSELVCEPVTISEPVEVLESVRVCEYV